MIYVTRSFIPEKDIYDNYMDKVWETQWLTNHGNLAITLKNELTKYLEIEDLVLTNNGTIALQIALRILGSGYEVITTPFSYIATASSIIWQNCQPVFVDIDPEHLTINENLIEQSITPKTKAILATHVFGNPCAVEALEYIGKKYNLSIIYDAAHAFGVEYNGTSLFNYGDISTCSFHATKVFHTGEGGAMFSKSEEVLHKIAYSANFGHKGHYDYHGLGINAKMSELHAAMGLSVLPSMGRIFEGRRAIVNTYLEHLDWDAINPLTIRTGTKWNWSYFPIIFKDEDTLLRCCEVLAHQGIFGRRYFYPSLNTIEYLKGLNMPIAEDISKRILCLPLYYGLGLQDVVRISKTINAFASNKVFNLNLPKIHAV